MKRIIVYILFAVLILTSCGKEVKHNDSFTEQDLKITAVNFEMSNVANFVKFLYTSPTLEQYREFKKSYLVDKALDKSLEETFSKIEPNRSTTVNVDIITEGFYIATNEELNLYYEISVMTKTQNTRVLVFVDTMKSMITSIKGYPVQ